MSITRLRWTLPRIYRVIDELREYARIAPAVGYRHRKIILSEFDEDEEGSHRILFPQERLADRNYDPNLDEIWLNIPLKKKINNKLDDIFCDYINETIGIYWSRFPFKQKRFWEFDGIYAKNIDEKFFDNFGEETVEKYCLECPQEFIETINGFVKILKKHAPAPKKEKN